MIRYYTGKPRSGKSYALVKSIHDNFMNSKSRDFKKHRYLYTNINGFKHDLINGIMLDHPLEDDNSKEGFFYKRSLAIKWDDLYSHLVKFYQIGDNDQELVDYCKKHRLYGAHFCIDECHMYFGKEDPVLVWWLGYHGHMGQDISFVTQNLRKVHEKYKLDCEMFLEAQPKSKAISHKQLRYIEFASDRFTPDQKTKSYSVIMKDNIHALYNSGDIHKPKSVVLPLLGFLVGSVIFAIIAFKYMFSSLAPDTGTVQETKPHTSNTNKTLPFSASKKPELKTLTENDLILYINCDSETCYNADRSFQHTTYPYGYTHNMLKQYALFLSVVNQNVVLLGDVPIAQLNTYAYQIDKTTAKILLPSFFITPEKTFENESYQSVKSAFVSGDPVSGGVASAEG